MSGSISLGVKKFGFPLSLIVAASLGGVLAVGSQSAAPAPAAVQPRLSSAAEVAAFKPFADQPAFKPSTVIAPAAPQTIVYQYNQAPPVAPVTALPVYGNIDDNRSIVVDGYRSSSVIGGNSVAPVGNGGAISAASTSTLPAGTTINLPSATINVGTATINVLSCYKLTSGGKPVSP